jgi:cysteinyl-tRNA synthetase
MKTAGYIGSLLPDGHLSVAPEVVRDMELQTNEQVQVVLIRIPPTPQDTERRAARRAEVWQRVDALRRRLSQKEFSLTDSLLQARQDEDASP